MSMQPSANSLRPSARRAWWLDLAILSLAIGAVFLLNLGLRPLAVPSEARYVEIGREMAETGDWITPRINGVPYLFKPPLFYWLQASVMRAVENSEFVFRLATAIFALAGCLTAYALGRVVHNREAGIASAVVMATTLLWFGMSRVVLLDVPVAVFVGMTLSAFLFATKAPEGSRARSAWFYSMYVSAAAATLTKGLIGMVLPGLVIGSWIALTGNWRLLRAAKLPSGTCLFLAIVLPWHAAIGLRTPEFWHFYFVREHFERFTSTVHGRTEPWWFFLAVIAVGFLPWSLVLLQALWRSLRRATRRLEGWKDELFLIVWVFGIVGFFSMSGSKLIPYMAPAVVPLAVIVGAYLSGGGERSSRTLHAAVLGVASLFFGLAIAAAWIVWGPRHDWIRALDGQDAVRAMIPWIGVGAGIAALCIPLALRHSIRAAFVVVALSGAALHHTVDAVMAANQPRSAKPLALALREIAAPDDEVILYRTFMHDVPVYLGRRVSVFGWSGELDFGRRWEDTSSWMFDDPEEFWRRWNAERPVYALVPARFLEEVKAGANGRFQEITRTSRFVLATNAPRGALERPRPD